MSQGELLPDVDMMFPPYKGFTGTYNPYFRRQKKKKAKIQLLSRKDTRKRPSRIMWIRRKKKKRKSRLAKQKYKRVGYFINKKQNVPGYTTVTQYGPSTILPSTGAMPDEDIYPSDPRWEQVHQAERWLDPQEYEGAYRRKRSKKKKEKTQTKKRKKSGLIKQRYNYNEEEGYGLGQSSGQVYDGIIAQKKKELKKRGPGKGQISFNDPSVYPEENEENVSYRRKPKVIWFRNKK